MTNPLASEERALVRGTPVAREDLPSLQGWFPVALADDPPGLWWRFLGDQRFTEPFFRDTLSGVQRDQRLCCRAAFDSLSEVGVFFAPTALIFHTSRCGSTLLTQLLASLPQCVVMSEPPVIDSFLRFHEANPGVSGGADILRRLIGALGQRRFPDERHFFVKLDSWHIHSLPLFRQAFPHTPLIFLYRRPSEVLASHRRQRGLQMVPGMIAQAEPQPLNAGDLDGYGRKVIEGFLAAAIRHANELMLLDYRQLPDIVWLRLLELFSVSCTPAEMAVMQARSMRHSKNPLQGFGGDPSPGSVGEDPAAERLYAELEQLRSLQPSPPIRATGFP